MITYYDIAKDLSVRPYQFIFPYLQCPFCQNAIDVRMKTIWTEYQLELKKKEKYRQKGWGKSQGMNINVPINANIPLTPNN